MNQYDSYELVLNKANKPVVRAGWANALLIHIALVIFLSVIASRLYSLSTPLMILITLILTYLIFRYYSSFVSRITIDHEYVTLTRPLITEVINLQQINKIIVQVQPHVGIIKMKIYCKKKSLSKSFRFVYLVAKSPPFEITLSLKQALEQRGILIDK